MKEARLFRRAIFIVDKNGYVTYCAYMAANREEPNYEEVLATAKKALEN
jgi:peroxiredoxin